MMTACGGGSGDDGGESNGDLALSNSSGELACSAIGLETRALPWMIF